jgi:small subunit ribosomal protein S3
LQRSIEAGALGIEISIRGKLTTDRARYEKYKAGYLPSVGEAISKIVRFAVVDTQLKQGLFGIRVRLMPPNANLPDKPSIRDVPSEPVTQKPILAQVVAETGGAKEVAQPANPEEA